MKQVNGLLETLGLIIPELGKMLSCKMRDKFFHLLLGGKWANSKGSFSFN